ncbi:MAG: LytTR family DNA-binding domain-containing protein [Clostridiales bacterium]|jgi:DNA-binding LytR/AlgR family response regulator|nr:LytTR family DNA-binding domain-containing protein [Clostridiales bacterium]
MKMVICEDEQYWREALQASVSKWASSKNIDAHFSCVASPQELIDNLSIHIDADVLFLDISLGEKEIDGVDLAGYIRGTGSSIPIVFVTSHSYRAVDGYAVEAIGFLEKPIDDIKLALFLDKIVKRKGSQTAIKVVADGRMSKIKKKDIIYVESRDHIVIYHTTQSNIEVRGTLSEALTSLGENCFFQIHRSFIIALDKINSIKTTYPYSVNLNKVKADDDDNLPVSRKYINDFLKVYSDDLLERLI